jgi:hypothetical protein
MAKLFYFCCYNLDILLLPKSFLKKTVQLFYLQISTLNYLKSLLFHTIVFLI